MFRFIDLRICTDKLYYYLLTLLIVVAKDFPFQWKLKSTVYIIYSELLYRSCVLFILLTLSLLSDLIVSRS